MIFQAFGQNAKWGINNNKNKNLNPQWQYKISYEINDLEESDSIYWTIVRSTTIRK